MDHTYLRYECADSFGLTVSASSKAPPSNSCLSFLPSSSQILLTTAGSCCVGFNLKSGLPQIKIAHREQLSGGVGTGRALNSDEIVCLDVTLHPASSFMKVATGWVDGAVRVFDVGQDEASRVIGVSHTLIDDNRDEEFFQREPLVLNGHNRSPVRTLAFDKSNVSRLASGGSDGTIILWDVVSESGLFRLVGHRGAVTDIMFVHMAGLDGMASSSLDGLVKVWDLGGQCCTQTIASNHGEVWGACLINMPKYESEQERIRLVVGGNDGITRVWSVRPSLRAGEKSKEDQRDAMDEEVADQDDVCHFMGRLLTPPNIATSSEKVMSIHYHPSRRFVGVLRANSRNLDIYATRSEKESQKKRQRRLRRRQERITKRSGIDKKEAAGRKRGLLDDPPSDHDDGDGDKSTNPSELLDPDLLKASDEFEFLATVRASHKISSFVFSPQKEKGESCRVVCSLSTNSLELHSVTKDLSASTTTAYLSKKVAVLDMYGHPTGIRAVGLSSDDRLACTVSKSMTKIWNMTSRTCIQSLSPSLQSDGKNLPVYGLCAAFLPGNMHVVVGTREGHLLLVDISSGEVVFAERTAHGGAIWSLDVRRPTPGDPVVAIMTGSADKSVKFWEIEAQDNLDTPMLVHTRTLQMTDDVVAVRYSHTPDASKLLVTVSTLDCTVKVLFEDSLKLFLSLYGHKLPALTIDISDDDVILASAGADKTVKIFGLDFGDTHRTLHGHEDSVTDLRFVRKTHNFFTSSKDGSVRFWDGDRFQQVLVLRGHQAEVNSLAVSRTGAFVVSAGMDREIRVWERTRDIVFVEEERERELEQVFESVNPRNEGATSAILDKKRSGGEEDEDLDDDNQPQSEAAVQRSVLSVAAGDRIQEALERADQETREIAVFRRTRGKDSSRKPNPLLLNLSPPEYVLWVLRSIKSADLEQSLVVLPLSHVERLMFYMISLLKEGRGVEICSRVSIFLVKTHQNQIIANRSLRVPLRELSQLIRQRLEEARDIAGFDIAGLKIISRAAQERQQSFAPIEKEVSDIWAGMGLGSEVAAALQDRRRHK